MGASASTMIDFDRLLFERLSFEVRYNGPLFIDRCGLVWREIEAKFPDVKATGIQPDGATFVLNKRSTTFKFNAYSLSIHEDYPPSLTGFSEIADFLIPRIVEAFELQVFTRIGVRSVHALPVKDKKEAETIILSSGLITLPENKIQLFGKETTDLAARFNIQDDDLSYTFNIGSVSRELQGTIPRPFTIQENQFALNVLAIDIDKFTRKSVAVGTASASDFIRLGQKTISNNLTSLFQTGRK
ncbi:MAG: hypothetical protein ACHQ1H_04935 [Nitrososphaerales archaeon]